MPLLGILDKFQEGRSHMAIVSRISVEKAASVKKVVKRGLTQRLRDRVGMGDIDSSDEETEGVGKRTGKKGRLDEDEDDGEDDKTTLKGGDGVIEKDFANGDREKDVSFGGNGKYGRGKGGVKSRHHHHQEQQMGGDLEMGVVETKKRSSFVQLPFAGAGLEQSMPADAVLAKAGAEEVCTPPTYPCS